MDNETIVIVSGLPRSGTSMMMKMLEAGGVEVLTDNIREADADNPMGYYEYEKVKDIKTDKSWIPAAEGKAVKMVSELLYHLPDDHNYKIIFMKRKIEEILASQHKMLERMGKDRDDVSDEELKVLFSRSLENIENWIDDKDNIDVLDVSFNRVMDKPGSQVDRVTKFLNNSLDKGKMIKIIDKSLYRQRK